MRHPDTLDCTVWRALATNYYDVYGSVRIYEWLKDRLLIDSDTTADDVDDAIVILKKTPPIRSPFTLGDVSLPLVWLTVRSITYGRLER